MALKLFYQILKKLIFFLFFTYLSNDSLARHVTGGEVNYKYLGPGSTANSKRYRITLKIFRDNSCDFAGPANPCSGMPVNVILGIYDNVDNEKVIPNISVPLESISPLAVVSSPACLDNPPAINYSMGLYTTDLDLPANTLGYSVVYQTYARVNGITNMVNAGLVGSTFAGTLPGSNTLPTGTDNSATFENGISIICFNQPFTLNFSATDEDGDVLQYSLVNAYNGGDAGDANYQFPAPPPFNSIPYSSGFSGGQCLGPLATINPSTGIISGTAPGAGKYIVCVAVKSYRNGVLISETRKDFIVTVAPCTSVTASLKPLYNFCDFGVGNQLTYSFANEGTSPLNLTFNWNFGDPASGASNTSASEFASHTFSAPGDYTLTLVVNQGTSCERTATALVKVYPGFFPNIPPIDPQCKNVPVNFIENGTTNYGVIDFWKWDFGIASLTNDTSRVRNPTYTYPNAGVYDISLIVKNSKGCIDTLTSQVTITENANLIISRDTLICAVDTLQLSSNFTNGTITWSPNYMISNVNSFNPLVSPDVTTTYTATYLSPSGCSAIKTVTVKVVNEVTLLALVDTSICRGDTARINTNTDALYFTWTPTNVIVNPTVRNPLVFPTLPLTTFQVKATISNKCFKIATVNVTTVPYPIANITGNSKICYGQNSQLNATGGSTYVWTPTSFLNNANIPNPISIKPFTSITYTVSVTDNLGCPKAVTKSFSLEVVKVNVNAGPADTSIVLNQPLQLNGTTTNATIFSWSPGIDLTSTIITNPISSTTNDIIYTLTGTNNIGCSASDSIRVKVFNVPPDIYVPSAFTPDGDVKNDVIRPIALGIKKLEYFSVYNRFGELIYKTSDIGKGWDGTYKGQKQLPGTYVWQAEAIDFKDKRIFKKGTVILIR
jgi:gliding motility-associated-like protein